MRFRTPLILICLAAIMTALTHWGVFIVIDSHYGNMHSDSSQIGHAIDIAVFSLFGAGFCSIAIGVGTRKGTERNLFIVLALLMLVTMTILEIIGKVYLPQPAAAKLSDQVEFGIALPYTSPSGHAIRASFLAFLLMPFVGKAVKTALSIVLVLMLASIVSSGNHYLSDVIIGCFLGAGGALLVNACTARREPLATPAGVDLS